MPPSPVAVAFWQETTAAARQHGGVAACRRRRAAPRARRRWRQQAWAQTPCRRVPWLATVDRGPETAAAAQRHVVMFKSPSVQQRRTTLPGLGACLQAPPIAGHTPPTPNVRPGGGGRHCTMCTCALPDSFELDVHHSPLFVDSCTITWWRLQRRRRAHRCTAHPPPQQPNQPTTVRGKVCEQPA